MLPLSLIQLYSYLKIFYIINILILYSSRAFFNKIILKEKNFKKTMFIIIEITISYFKIIKSIIKNIVIIFLNFFYDFS
jgi:hypothetical protein